MTTTSQATAAPVPVELAGATYRMSPLRDSDFGELERHLQNRALLVARQMCENASPAEREVLMKAAYEKAYAIDITSPDVGRYVNGYDGAAYLLWLGLRHNHPELTPAKVRELLTDERTVAAALDKFDDANAPDPGAGEGDAKKKASPPPTRAEKNRRRRGPAGLTAAPSTATSPSGTGGPLTISAA